MIMINGYCLIYYREKNEIRITLPQTERTATNTVTPCVNRRLYVSDEELTALLGKVIEIFKREIGDGKWLKKEAKENV